MGEVFRGVHEGLQRPVAIKIVPLSSQESVGVESLLLEARALAKIEHPNIVRVYDVGIQDGLFYIVMQFLEGDTLKARFDASGALPEGEFYSAVEGLARGLDGMHAAGLIHRDLKLENVILTPEGQAKIMDFGLVRDPGAKDEYQGRIVGTLPYIPPELWEGKTADERSDLYSLGVIFYTLLCGAYPYRAKSTDAYRELHLAAKPKHPAEVNPSVEENLSAVALKLMSRSPAKRYASVKEFLKDLDLCRRGDTPEALRSTGRKVKCGLRRGHARQAPQVQRLRDLARGDRRDRPEDGRERGRLPRLRRPAGAPLPHLSALPQGHLRQLPPRPQRAREPLRRLPLDPLTGVVPASPGS
jgi:serine/threonine-protein kinase